MRVGRKQRRVRVEGRDSEDWMAVDLGKPDAMGGSCMCMHMHACCVQKAVKGQGFIWGGPGDQGKYVSPQETMSPPKKF